MRGLAALDAGVQLFESCDVFITHKTPNSSWKRLPYGKCLYCTKVGSRVLTNVESDISVKKKSFKYNDLYELAFEFTFQIRLPRWQEPVSKGQVCLLALHGLAHHSIGISNHAHTPVRR